MDESALTVTSQSYDEQRFISEGLAMKTATAAVPTGTRGAGTPPPPVFSRLKIKTTTKLNDDIYLRNFNKATQQGNWLCGSFASSADSVVLKALNNGGNDADNNNDDIGDSVWGVDYLR